MAKSWAGRHRGGSGPRRRRWPRRLLIGTGATLLVGALVGFVVAPPLIRRVAEAQLGAWLGRRVTVARVRVNPLSLAVTVEGARVYEADARTVFFAFSRLRVDVEARSLIRRGLVAREVRLESPRVRIVRERAVPEQPLAGYNFSDIVARIGAPPAAGEASKPPRFSLANVQIVDGAVTYEDRPTSSRHDISGLALGVPFVSTLPADTDVFVEPGLSLRVDGAPFELVGRTQPFKDSGNTTARARISALDLTRWLPDLPRHLPVDVTSALLSVDLDVAFARPPAATPTLTLKGRVALDRLAVRAEDGAPLVRMDELAIQVGQIDVPARRFVFDEVTLAGLDVRARRLRDGTLDWQRLLEGAPPKQSHERVRPAAARTRPLVEIGALVIEAAAVHLHDEAVRPPTDLVVAPIDLSSRHLSNAPGARGEVTLALRATPGGTLKQEGTITFEPLAATGSVTVDVPAVGRLAPYYRDAVAVDVPSGRLRLTGRYQLASGRGGPRLVFSRVSLGVTGLVVRRLGAAPSDILLRLPSMNVRDGAVDVGARVVSIGRVGAKDGEARVVREADGALALASVVRPSTGAKGTPSAPWTVEISRVDLERWRARFEDHSVEPAVLATAAPLTVHARQLRLAPELRGDLDVHLGVGDRGQLAVSGTAEIEPLALDVRVALTAVPIRPFQGYFARFLGATVTEGVVSAAGRMKLSLPAAPVGGPARALRLDIAAGAEASNVVTFDAREGKELARWSSLRVDGVALSLAPFRLAIHGVVLADLRARLAVEPDRSMNVGPRRSAAAPPPVHGTAAPAAADRPATEPAPSIEIGAVEVDRAHVRFVDRSIRPPFIADLDALDVRVSGLSSRDTARANLELRGRMNRWATLGVTGKINPLDGKLFADLKLDLRDLDVPPLGPYAGKYLGYAVEKGKLDLSIDCHIREDQLTAETQIGLDHLGLGAKVESPKALSLPVPLPAAVRLLENRRDRIDLHLPVHGRLGDPTFSFRQTINRALTNVVARAATSPIALVMAIFDRNSVKSLPPIDFAPGTATPNASAAGQLRALAQRLREQPTLTLEIAGVADPERDLEAPRQAALEPPASKTPAAPSREDQLLALARRRAAFVRDALTRAVPDCGPRLFVVAPQIVNGTGHVGLRLKKD